MSSFDFEANSLFSGFREIDEGVYFKHYGFDVLEMNEASDDIDTNSFGYIEEKSMLWQKQIEINGDCIALKSVVDRSLTKENVEQSTIMAESLERGLFSKDCGSSFDDFVELFKTNSFNNGENVNNKEFAVDIISNGSLLELTECVESSEEIICYVNKMLLDYDGNCDFIGLNADGLVHVIGVVFNDSNGDYVIINDTENDDGAGRKIELSKFLKAWSSSDYTAITVAWR